MKKILLFMLLTLCLVGCKQTEADESLPIVSNNSNENVSDNAIAETKQLEFSFTVDELVSILLDNKTLDCRTTITNELNTNSDLFKDMIKTPLDETNIWSVDKSLNGMLNNDLNINESIEVNLYKLGYGNNATVVIHNISDKILSVKECIDNGYFYYKSDSNLMIVCTDFYELYDYLGNPSEIYKVKNENDKFVDITKIDDTRKITANYYQIYKFDGFTYVKMVREIFKVNNAFEIIDQSMDPYGKYEYYFPETYDYSNVLNIYK